jgi:alkanesulfonate monooxygenase SsuD/methylene tetrahydromethanopterin reductase-like flavin-dependent oxidoreductase (luciferase family)
MRYSVFSVLDDHPQRRAEWGGDRYEEALALAREADRDGLDTFWVAEHHFHSGGVLPAPAVFLGGAARETRRIRLGVLVAVLPLHRPRELAEALLTVDHLSRGRLEIGLGSGYVPLEFQGYGEDLERRRQTFDARYPEFLAALQGDALSAPGSAEGSVRLNIRAVQRPHPPLWMAVQSREALPFVARRGLSVAMIPYASMAGLSELESRVRLFREALPPGTTARVAAAFHVFVGEDPAPGLSALRTYLGERLSTQSTHYAARADQDPEGSSAEGLVARNLALVGRPEEVSAQVREVEATGITDLFGIFDFGGLPPVRSRASLRRFASLVGLTNGR